MPTISEIVSLYPIAQYLSCNAIQNRGLYGGGINVSLPQKIRNIGKSVERIYNNNSSDSTLPLTANFLWTLEGIFGQQALNVVQQNGYISSIAFTDISPTPIQFIVDSSSSFIVDGDVTKVFPSSWIGWDLQFFRAHVIQSTNAPDVGTYYSWDKTTATLTLLAAITSPVTNPAAVAGEEFQFFPV